jgi:UDPglucose--hexose-1-phosphate uridylyltransferase
VKPYPLWKHAARLADGREIIYFDESPGLGRHTVADTRDLGKPPHGAPGTPPEPASALRWDPLAGEWVVIAEQRQDRTFLPPADACPLDPSAPGRPTEIPASSYDVVVFENRFPSLSGAEPSQRPPSALPPGGPGADLFALRPGYGRCEVVCFTADHDASFADLTPARVRTVLEAWADRTAALSAIDGIEQVFCFENRGEEIGVTLHHPHGQIYGYPFVTPRTARLLEQAGRYAERTGGNLFDDLLAGEQASGSRVIARNAYWTAFVPAAARWPYEILLFPAERVPDLTLLADPVRAAFCPIYLDVLRRLDGLFGSRAPYIAAWHQAPGLAGSAGGVPGGVRAGGGPGAIAHENPAPGLADRADFALHLQVMSVRRAPGKLKYLAGSESGMGVWINDIVPETAARRLREVR